MERALADDYLSRDPSSRNVLPPSGHIQAAAECIDDYALSENEVDDSAFVGDVRFTLRPGLL